LEIKVFDKMFIRKISFMEKYELSFQLWWDNGLFLDRVTGGTRAGEGSEFQ
jgi:hypothetical protein